MDTSGKVPPQVPTHGTQVRGQTGALMGQGAGEEGGGAPFSRSFAPVTPVVAITSPGHLVITTPTPNYLPHTVITAVTQFPWHWEVTSRIPALPRPAWDTHTTTRTSTTKCGK
ncbi:hypothetical protein E2C01_057154 [Portunus trituberculatus]|uniref:Uncharacterized protein n=1 Tax=Portunus trituberculatus TaxID=210409 RepID=A0A5B7GW20_PORTR|nr:hypothetical protein [Portunus trituberculatus]